MGRLCTEIEDAIAGEERGDHIILIRRETSPADIAGMAAASGLVTTLGGLVSHAAVVARSWGVPAVVGAVGLTVLPHGIRVGDRTVAAGEMLTIDGDRGLVLLGDHRSEETEVEEVRILRRWLREASESSPEAAVASGGSGEIPTARSCERVLALKGMGSVESIAGVLGCSAADVRPIAAELVAAGRAQNLPGDRIRLLPAALARVDERYAADAVRLTPVIEPVLDEFHTVNDHFKHVVTAWQIREIDGESVPNDHTDDGYDTGVIGRLRAEVHASIVPIIETVAAAEPRFGRYVERLDAALTAVEGGDAQMVAHPLRDSYHTVWFELHEEMIRLTGRNRADEAEAGRA